MEKISEFIVKHFAINSFKDVCWLIPKILIAIFVLHELYYDFHYLKNLFLNDKGMLLFSLAKRILVVVLIYLWIKLVLKKGRVKAFTILLITFQIYLCIFSGWYHGRAGWLRCGLGGIFYINGPYIGNVVDADTGTPIPDALVAGVWKFDSMIFISDIRSYADIRETFTSPKGSFILAPARRFFFWPFSVISLYEFKVFKPGYETVSSIPKYPLKPINVKLKKAKTIEERRNALLDAQDIKAGATYFDIYKIKKSENIFIEEKKYLRKIK